MLALTQLKLKKLLPMFDLGHRDDDFINGSQVGPHFANSVNRCTQVTNQLCHFKSHRSFFLKEGNFTKLRLHFR